MPITIKTNVSALSAQRNLGINTSKSTSSLSKLSSGSRVPSSKDDAAALSIATGLRVDIAASRMAQMNAQQGASMLQVADGAYSQISDILIRMKSISSQAVSGQISNTERGFLNTEYQELSAEVDRIATTTEFNSQKLLGGISGYTNFFRGLNVNTDRGVVGVSYMDGASVSLAVLVSYNDTHGNLTLTNTLGDNRGWAQSINLGSSGDVIADPGQIKEVKFDEIGIILTLNSDFNGGNPIGAGADITTNHINNWIGSFVNAAGKANEYSEDIQVGIGTSANDSLNITIDHGTVRSLGIDNTNVSDVANAQNAITKLDSAIARVSSSRSKIGAMINRLEFAGNNAAIAGENFTAVKSLMMDVDVSHEITEFSASQVLIQSGISMIQQAQEQPKLLLELLQ